MNLPNILTLLRIVLIPVFIGTFFIPSMWSHYYSTLIFSIAAVTDWVDGWFARNRNQTTPFGAFLDPVADKLIVSIALVLLTHHYQDMWITLAAAIIIGRELTISALREWMAERGKRAAVAVSYVGKVKTVVQMLALLMLLEKYPLFGLPIYETGYVLLFIAALLTLWSMFVYLKAALPLLLEDE